MSNKNDIYIKEKLKSDDLISKKAEDVFNNFFKNDIHRIEVKKVPDEIYKIEDLKNTQEEKSVQENTNVEEIEYTKENENTQESEETNRVRKSKVLPMVASFVIVFLAANAYAATQGYNNIFFAIRNMIVHEEITDSSEILTDKDITISYQPIEIADGVKLQINKLTVQDNKAELYLNITRDNMDTIMPSKYVVYDITNGDSTVIGNQSNILEKNSVNYVEKIQLNGMKNITEKLRLDIMDKSNSEIVSLEIDLEKREIDVTRSLINELQKLSEVELKEILGKYVALNEMQDLYKDEINAEYTEEQFKNTSKIILATNMIFDKEFENGTRPEKYTLDEVNEVLKEFVGEEITDPQNITDNIIYYNKDEKAYEYYSGDYSVDPLCLEIENISFLNGVYTVTIDYCYPSESDWMDGTIESLDIFKTTMKFKLNSNYKYAKYCLVNANNLQSEKIKK